MVAQLHANHRFKTFKVLTDSLYQKETVTNGTKLLDKECQAIKRELEVRTLIGQHFYLLSEHVGNLTIHQLLDGYWSDSL